MSNADATVSQLFDAGILKTGQISLKNEVDMSAKQNDYMCMRPSRFSAFCINKGLMKSVAQIGHDISSQASQEGAGTETTTTGDSGISQIIDSLPMFEPSTAVRMEGEAKDKCYQVSYPMLDGFMQLVQEESSENLDDGELGDMQSSLLETLSAAFDSDSKDPFFVVCASHKSDAAYSLSNQMTGLIMMGVMAQTAVDPSSALPDDGGGVDDELVVDGCMDSNATNYDADANVNDDSCVYV